MDYFQSILDELCRPIELMDGEHVLWRSRQWVVTNHVVQPHGENEGYHIDLGRLA